MSKNQNNNNTFKLSDESDYEYILKFIEKFNLQDRANDEIKQSIVFLKDKYGADVLQNLSKHFKNLKEGDRVKLNLESIKSHPDYPRLTEKYRRFVGDNADKVFTVEYDAKHQNNPCLVCLKEDETDPKWLWWEGNLELVKDGDKD